MHWKPSSPFCSLSICLPNWHPECCRTCRYILQLVPLSFSFSTRGKLLLIQVFIKLQPSFHAPSSFLLQVNSVGGLYSRKASGKGPTTPTQACHDAKRGHMRNSYSKVFNFHLMYVDCFVWKSCLGHVALAPKRLTPQRTCSLKACLSFLSVTLCVHQQLCAHAVGAGYAQGSGGREEGRNNPIEDIACLCFACHLLHISFHTHKPRTGATISAWGIERRKLNCFRAPDSLPAAATSTRLTTYLTFKNKWSLWHSCACIGVWVWKYPFVYLYTAREASKMSASMPSSLVGAHVARLTLYSVFLPECKNNLLIN